jgi:hypothetical protein
MRLENMQNIDQKPERNIKRYSQSKFGSDKKLRGPQSRSGGGSEEKKISTPARNRTPPTQPLVTILT